jgi:hypothetical protein
MENAQYKSLLKILSNALGFRNVILLHKDRRHVATTHMPSEGGENNNRNIMFRITTLKMAK